MLTIKDIQTPRYNTRTRRLLFEEIHEEISISSAAAKALGLKISDQFEDIDHLLTEVGLKEYAEAKGRTLRLLSLRDHSQYELKQKLKAESFQEDTIVQVLEYLKDYLLIDDVRMLQTILERELARGAGINKIKMKLKTKGFTDAQIEDASLELEGKDYDARALETALKLIAGLDISEYKNRDKAYRKLRNKGYTHELTRHAIDERIRLDKPL